MDKALYALLGTILGAFISTTGLLIRDWLTNRNNIKLEKIKIHDKDTLEAYKRLFLFAKKLANISFPLSTNKRNQFTQVMSKYYNDKIENDYLYFNSDIISRLLKINNMYVCMTSPDLMSETEDQIKNFLENELFKTALELENYVLQNVPRLSE